MLVFGCSISHPGHPLRPLQRVNQAVRRLAIPAERGTGHRKFSTSIRSLLASSNCENKRNRPSGETESPSDGGADIGATVFTLAVAKLRNWIEDFRSVPGSGMK